VQNIIKMGRTEIHNVQDLNLISFCLVQRHGYRSVVGYRINQISIDRFKVFPAFFLHFLKKRTKNSFESRYLPGDTANSPEPSGSYFTVLNEN